MYTTRQMYQSEIVYFAGFDFIFDNFGANTSGSLSLSLSLAHNSWRVLFDDAAE